MNHKLRHAGQAIVDSLAVHGVKRVFAVPGESYLAVLDGLHGTSIETVVARHEGGAAYMAEAHGKLTGEPGVAMVTRGPGAANASVAIHSAWQDGTPLVLFVGLVPIADRMRESFQEFDPNAWFGTQTKRVFVLDEPGRASEIVAEAFFAAKSGRPGPVIVGLPEDVIAKDFDGEIATPIPVTEGAVSPRELDQLRTALSAAENPLIYVGGQRWTRESSAAITRFAERNGIPVAQDWHASDRIPFTSPVNIGTLGYGRGATAAEMFDEADVLLAIGALPTDVPTDGFTLRQRPDAVNYIVSIDTTLRGRSGAVTAHMLASPVAFAEAVEDLDLGRAAEWDNWRARGHQAHLALSAIGDYADLPAAAEGTAHMSVVINELIQRLPDDAMCTLGAGNHTIWAQRFFPTNVFPSQLATRNGSMGYSIPSAVAAGLENPERLIVAVCGDGEFLMNGQELATAAQYGVPILGIVMDNGQYATIRDHQESHFPGRVSGTQLSNPDFAALVRAFGGHAETVTSDAEAAGAVERALKAVMGQRRSALIHVITDQRISLP
ncbi:acetolactate synthase-1/2/3 large subunit [Arthrobacter pascens]|uniref:thiamine pyrophosphate-dependent enzyme n=1 Tax=Arthrobacter pascens TaxID=1677 RepID=UPI0027800160|nr:thiamine pyrophosphate-dependent enzyme [Arthrobacter pascens]MDQ0634388.1 acetolactate synthase-1/2/3 large subunit [Arthrobacter pascens]